MFHDTALARAARAKADPRPASAVSTGCGLAGLAGLVGWVGVARYYGMDGPYSALTNVAACALPMVLWSLIVDKVHRNASTGMDWANPKPWRETIDISLTKLAGLWITWGAIALIYATERVYWDGNFAFAMWCFEEAAPVLFVASIPYIILLDRHATEPEDGCWALGAWLMGLNEPIDRELIFNHLRSWAVKGFFTAFMLGGMPGGFGTLVRGDIAQVLHDPVALAVWLIGFMFVIDMAFATVGYLMAFKPLDSHIRTANPFTAGWVAALICYPPIALMGPGGLLDYSEGTRDWTHWFAAHDWIAACVGAVLVVLTGIYAWATIAFGYRFSNLTHRGIITHGPYAFSRHPAYLAKNIFWWLSTIPFLTTGTLADAARATILLGAVSGVYYWRAKTEERHLRTDPAYVAYSDWVGRNGLVPNVMAWVTGKPSPARSDG